MVDNGDGGKQIWLTEVGAPTGGPGGLATESNLGFDIHPDHVDESLQTKILNDVITKSQSYSWAGPVFWYSYRDLGSTNNTNENFFGLLRADGTRKPAYDLFKSLVVPKAQ